MGSIVRCRLTPRLSCPKGNCFYEPFHRHECPAQNKKPKQQMSKDMTSEAFTGSNRIFNGMHEAFAFHPANPFILKILVQTKKDGMTGRLEDGATGWVQGGEADALRA